MFKVSENTLGSEVVYKLPIPGEAKPAKFSLTVFGKGIFDSISLSFLNLCSHVFSGLKPCRVSIGIPNIGKMFTTRRKIENFLLNETQAFLKQNNQSISKANIKGNILEIMRKQNLDKEILLPKLLKDVHAKSMRDYGVMERTLYRRVADYIEGQPGKNRNLPISFSVSENGTIAGSDAPNGVYMEILVVNNQMILQPTLETFVKGFPVHVQTLYKAFDLDPDKPFDPLEILQSAIDANIENEYYTFLEGEMPPMSTKVDEVILTTNGNDISTGMHKITLNNNHYIASRMWTRKDAAEFWASVLALHPAVIVKLTTDIPNKEEPLYWPNSVGAIWVSKNPSIPTVTCKSIQRLNKDLVKRVFELRTEKQTFQVTHLDYLGWEDMSVPKKSSFQTLLAEVDKVCPVTSAEHPMLVHCKGGIGRTGTFITIHAAKKTPKINRSETMFYEIVLELRRQRPLPMVETQKQYLFAHLMMV